MNYIFKIISILGILVLALVACSNSDDDITDASTGNETPIDNETPTATNYDITSILSKFEGIGLSYAVNGNTVTFTTQDLPNHTSPYYPTTNNLYEAYNGTNSNYKQNPNKIATQNITLKISLKPSEATVHAPTPLGAIGVSRNGVVFYNQYAGPNQPLTTEIDSFDQYLGHPTATSQYHYHIEPTYLTEQFGEDAFLGLLSDGFPVYGPKENGEIITNDDLDAYHGHTAATADFPDGIYHYHITNQDPYINGNGFFGTPGTITN